VRRLARRLIREASGEVRGCYEAGPLGYACNASSGPRAWSLFSCGPTAVERSIFECSSSPGSMGPHARSTHTRSHRLAAGFSSHHG